MAFFIVKYDGRIYANKSLCIAALTETEASLINMLVNKDIIGEQIFDQHLFVLDKEQEGRCMKYSPSVCDFDDFYKHLNILSADTVKDLVKYGSSPSLPQATTVKVNPNIISEQYIYRQVSFFRALDFKEDEKYRMVPKTASVKICKYLYIAINAVDIRIEDPIVVTLLNK